MPPCRCRTCSCCEEKGVLGAGEEERVYRTTYAHCHLRHCMQDAIHHVRELEGHLGGNDQDEQVRRLLDLVVREPVGGDVRPGPCTVPCVPDAHEEGAEFLC